ncbi:MAG TPA: AAA family ATPase, partial [Symbiobacteriaceae bacterium]|nr:AAA family ATPase [Symbiobacteriaceae bacterium]
MSVMLATKFFAPSARPDLLPRPQLLRRLEDGLRAGRRVTLVTAPAGYGKSTLITAWLASRAEPFAWLSLDAGDNDPARFLAYLFAACQRATGELLGPPPDSLVTSPLAPADLMMMPLINSLAGRETPLVFVLDDYHYIQATYVHDCIQCLVDHQPAGIHLVLVTRVDPPLSLPRWRVRNQITEMRTDDLRFSPDEAAAFLRGLTGLALPDEAVALLDARTEGWVAGLQLAALSMQGWDADRAAAFIRSFSGTHHFVLDYLVDEVLRQQAPEVREFLCQTAILDRLGADLCDAVTARQESRTMLARLAQSNLFLIPLDESRQWYRYHHLFADVLRMQSDRRLQAPLHLRAAHWFEAHGEPAEAVRHALAAEDSAEAERLILAAADGMLQSGLGRTVLEWLALLPAERLMANPDLIATHAWALFLTGKVP